MITKVTESRVPVAKDAQVPVAKDAQQITTVKTLELIIVLYQNPRINHSSLLPLLTGESRANPGGAKHTHKPGEPRLRNYGQKSGKPQDTDSNRAKPQETQVKTRVPGTTQENTTKTNKRTGQTPRTPGSTQETKTAKYQPPIRKFTTKLEPYNKTRPNGNIPVRKMS